MRRLFYCLLPAAGCLLFAGCGSRLNTVVGKVTLADGSPLTRGMIVFDGMMDGKTVSPRGEIKADGTFVLGTLKPGDGVPTGKYRALINPLDSSEVPDEQKHIPFDYKYCRLDTSGLEFTVEPGKNEFTIKLDPPRHRR